jgi:hypothetical protein
MSVKSVIDIDVNDQSFQRFKELFDKYNAQLGKMPNAWKEAGKQSAETASQFERMAAALMAQSHLAREVAVNSRHQEKTLTHQERMWTAIERSTKGVAANILGATSSLLRWTGVLGAVSGLLGVGGVFGLERLGEKISNSRRSSMGLGMTIGQEKSFDINMSRFVNPGAFLSGINTATTDIGSPTRATLDAMGVNPNGSTTQVAAATIRWLIAKARATPVDQLGTVERYYNLGSIGVSEEDFRRFKTHPNEALTQLMRALADANSMNLGHRKGRAWQDFTTQMSRAGTQVETAFENFLTPLTGPLTALSQSFIGLVERITKNDAPFKAGIKAIGDWINSLSGSLEKPAFLKHFDQFLSDLDKIAVAVHDIAWGFHHPGKALVKGTVATVKGEYLAANNAMQGIGSGVLSTIGDWITGKTAIKNEIIAEAHKHGVPVDFALRQWGAESSKSTDATLTSQRGAVGPLQVQPWLMRQYGHMSMYDVNQQIETAMRFDAHLIGKYHNNLKRVAAAYNMGETKFDEILSGSHGRPWERSVQPGVLSYVAKTTGVHITVHSVPGSNMVAVANGLGSQ